MKLTHKQKKFIKKNRYKLTAEEMARKLEVSTAEVTPYLPASQSHLGSSDELTASNGRLRWHTTNFAWKQWWHEFWPYVLLVLGLGVAVYANGLNSAFVSDDIAGIVHNSAMNNFGSLFTNLTGILRQIVFFMTFQLVGPTPIFFRLPSLLLHLGSAVLIMLIGSFGFSRKTAVMAACLFVIHPLLVESVTWISGSNYSQYTFFLLLSFAAYLLSNGRGARYIVVAIVAFIAALLSSEKAMVFPAILLVSAALQGNLKASWKKLTVFFGLSGVWALYYGSKIGSRLTSNIVDYYAASGDTYYNPLVQVPVAITNYLRLFVWPVGLSLYHSDLSTNTIQFTGVWILFLILIGLYAWSFFKNKMIFFWISWFWISLLPTLTPFKVAWVVAERYVYFGTVGLCMIAAWLIQLSTRRWQQYYLDWVVLLFFVSILGTFTVMRNVDWWNEDNLWLSMEQTAANFPQNHNNLGDMYSRRRDFAKAIDEFTIATRLNPRYADAYHNLATAYYQSGNVAKAIENYDKALAINPRLWQGYQAKAMIEFDQKKLAAAEAYMQQAIDLAPQNSDGRYNMGVVYAEGGKLLQAQAEFKQALVLEPYNLKAQQALQILDARLNAGQAPSTPSSSTGASASAVVTPL